MADIWRHYKGGIYNLIGIGKHTETREELVFYEDTEGRLWARPKHNFFEEIDLGNTKVPRFQRLGHFNK